MHPIIAACFLLLVVGALIALRWGHLEIAPPWTIDPEADVAIPERLRRVLWFAAVFTYAAVTSGLTVLGPGGRLVMRLLAVTAGDDAQGRVTEAEEVVGAITVDGTIGLVLFAGLFGGIVLAALALVLRKWLPPTRWGALTVALVFGVLSSTRLEPLRPDNPDFRIVGPAWLAVTTFLALGVLTMLTMTAAAARLSRSLPQVEMRVGAIAPYAILVIVLPLGSILAPAVLGTIVGVLLLRRADFRRVWADRRVLLAGRVAIAAVVLALLPAFVGDVADILG